MIGIMNYWGFFFFFLFVKRINGFFIIRDELKGCEIWKSKLIYIELVSKIYIFLIWILNKIGCYERYFISGIFG